MSVDKENISDYKKTYENSFWCKDHSGNNYSFAEYKYLTEKFHGYAAPGLLIGGKMVDIALSHLPNDILFDAVCETDFCLPDAVQILTLCTTGNGWLNVIHLGRFSLSLYDKYNGKGVRVNIDTDRIKKYPEIESWFYKLKTKKEQNNDLLTSQILTAGEYFFHVNEINIKESYLSKRAIGKTAICPLCREAYPIKHGSICRGCQGESPFNKDEQKNKISKNQLKAIPTESAIGKNLLHDMTGIIPGKEKGAVFKKGHKISATDICKLQFIGKNHVYTEDMETGDEYIHEDEAVLSFASRMCGERLIFKDPPSEGKINFTSSINGLLVVDEKRLEAFNLVSGVMCATRKNYSVVSKGRDVAGTRAIPLFLHRKDFNKAISIIDQPLFKVLPFRKSRIGILITGTEVFNGLVEDKFEDVIRSKAEKMNCSVVEAIIVPDNKAVITKGIKHLIEMGAEVIVTTAGLSVDPEDVTKDGLIEAGAENLLYGVPVLPGAMSLLCDISGVKIIGIPACGLFFQTTGFDLLLPRILADVKITRNDLAKMGHGSFCLSCKTCRFPRCNFGK
ncbi:MAG: trehalose-binding protein [Desulfobacterales bacterium]|nr:trehalose-binding protein [Desulfobacterales bacterium]